MHAKRWAVAVAAVMGLVGCGSEDTYVYDVEFDAGKLANVTTHCELIAGSAPQGAARNLAAQQRWTLRDDRYGATLLEVPDLDFSLPAGPYRYDGDDAPDVLSGTAPDMSGPVQYADLQSERSGFFSSRTAFQINIQKGAREDTLQGFVWLRYEQISVEDVGGGKYVGECTSYVPFTGRRVAQ